MAKKKEAKEKLEEHFLLARCYFDKFPNISVTKRIKKMIEGYDGCADVNMYGSGNDSWLRACMVIYSEPSRIQARVDAFKDDINKCLTDYPGKCGACVKLFCCSQPQVIGDYRDW